MKMVGTLNLKLFTFKGIAKERATSRSREIYPCFVYQKRVAIRNCMPLVVSNEPMSANSIFDASSSQVDASSICNVESQCDTAHVEFKLKKKCEFGQRFTLVGDDPVLGLWDPCDGVPLHWSDDHVWTAQVDIPSGKVVKYKFILMNGAGIISWQPGSDRILETKNSEKTVVVFEDWDVDPQLQNIVDEEPETGVNEEESLILNGCLSLVPISVDQPVHEEGGYDIEFGGLFNPIVNNTDILEDLSSAVQEPGPSLVDNKEQDQGATSGSDDGKEVNGSHFSDNGNNKWLVSDYGVPIPVPGFVLMPTAQEKIGAKEYSTSTGVLDPTENEVRAREVASSGLMHPVETKEQSSYKKGTSEVNNNILARDLRWGRETLQKFLANFGFE